MGFEVVFAPIISVQMGKFVSHYPGRSAGLALLILRCSLAARFAYLGYMLHVSVVDLKILVIAAFALALLLGFVTQIGAIAYAGAALFSFHSVGGVEGTSIALTALPAISLALLGPGAFSLDARLYGHREISLE